MPRLNKFSEDEKAQRRAHALEMRRAGADLDQIARRLGYVSVSAAKRDLSQAYTDVLKTPTEEARALDLLRIDRMIMALWPDARSGISAAVDRVAKLIDLRARFLGTYAPTQVEQVSFDAVEQEIKRLEAELGANPRGNGRKYERRNDAAGAGTSE
jgi:hypothetical protein